MPHQKQFFLISFFCYCFFTVLMDESSLRYEFYVLSFLNHRFLIFCVSLNIRNISWSYSWVERVLWNINYSLISVHVWYSRHTDEGRVAAIEEGAVEHLQDEGEVLKRQVWGGGTNGKQQALQGRQEERKHRRPQVHLLLALPYKHNNDLRLKCACCSLWIGSQPEGLSSDETED